MTEEETIAKETQPVAQTATPETQTTGTQTTEIQSTSPYAFYVVTLALVLVSLVGFSTMLIFRDIFEHATDVTTVLGSLFAVVGTLVGTYFGIKSSGDANDKARLATDRAHEVANRALAELAPEAGRRVVRDTSRTPL